MKKYTVGLSLMLLFAMGVTIGMEEYRGKVYITNRVKIPGGANPIECKVLDKNGNSKKVIVKNAEQTELLGDISSIAKIEVGTYLSHSATFGKLGELYDKCDPMTMLINKLKTMDDITNDFLAKIKTDYRPGDVMKIVVDWKYPGSYCSREWKYTFVTGVFNPSMRSYPWKWVMNNTRSEIQVREIVDPNSIYAQEAAEQGLPIGNPIKIAPGQRWEIFEENKRFEVYSKVSGWFEPDYANLEQQVAEGLRKDENKYKSPAISIGSTYTGGWEFKIVWFVR